MIFVIINIVITSGHTTSGNLCSVTTLYLGHLQIRVPLGFGQSTIWGLYCCVTGVTEVTVENIRYSYIQIIQRISDNYLLVFERQSQEEILGVLCNSRTIAMERSFREKLVTGKVIKNSMGCIRVCEIAQCLRTQKQVMPL